MVAFLRPVGEGVILGQQRYRRWLALSAQPSVAALYLGSVLRVDGDVTRDSGPASPRALCRVYKPASRLSQLVSEFPPPVLASRSTAS